jgi:prepilin-type processing-associated H-X9-DG protein
MNQRHRHGNRAGLTIVDVLVLLVVIGVGVLFLLMATSRGREQARLAGCRKNLAQIGMALSLYDQMSGHLPKIGPLGPPDGSTEPQSPSPLKILLETLQLPDLSEIRDSKTRPDPRPGQVPQDIRVRGFICASDPNALSASFLAPINYRAVTGDGPLGQHGAFATGPAHSLAEIEARDGLSYTAAFSERLVGDDHAAHAAPINYQIVPTPLPSGGCLLPSDPSAWRGDAGSSWASAGYRSTLYNHALPPDARSSCIAIDGRSAFMGASSGHVGGVNLLLLDGSVSSIRPSINPTVWRDYATIGSSSQGETE